MIDHPLQHILGARGRFVEAFGSPQHPVPFAQFVLVRKDLQRQKLASIVCATPTAPTSLNAARPNIDPRKKRLPFGDIARLRAMSDPSSRNTRPFSVNRLLS